VSVSDVREGDLLKAYDVEEKREIFSRFTTYAHADASMYGKYLQVLTSGQKTIKLSEMHFIAREVNENVEFVHANKITVGDIVLTSNGQKETVLSVEESVERGAYAPLTEQGTVIVNGIVASCYANYQSHEMAHLVHPTVTSFTQFVNSYLGYKDTTDMARQLGLFSLVSSFVSV